MAALIVPFALLVACGRPAAVPATESVEVGQRQSNLPAASATGGTATRRTACSIVTGPEVAQILAALIGKPTEEDADGKTSCVYPPGDAGSSEQATLEIEWDHGAASAEDARLVEALGGSEAGREIVHRVSLGDQAVYSIDGQMSIRAGNTLINIGVTPGTDSESRAIAIGRLALKRLSLTLDAATPALPGQQDSSGVSLTRREHAKKDGFPEELTVGEQCPEIADGPNDAEAALIPLKVGLTLSSIWDGGGDNYDHECLLQVVAMTPAYVDVTHSCPKGADHHNVSNKRRICRGDFRDAYFYRTETSPKAPAVVYPSTMFSLSTHSFHELKTTGKTRHRYFEIDDNWRSLVKPLEVDIDTILRDTRDRQPYKITVNGGQVDLPTVITVSQDQRVKATVLDDERFPLVLRYETPEGGLKMIYTKISYPTGTELEQHLATDRHVDVYGIYFDFASDRLRVESTPVLEEIAAVLSKNTDWKLSINGHTDNVGGDAANLELSKKRALAVKTALVQRYGIAVGRLTTGGLGAAQPQATNDTPEGRARNRRVELTRQ